MINQFYRFSYLLLALLCLASCTKENIDQDSLLSPPSSVDLVTTYLNNTITDPDADINIIANGLTFTSTTPSISIKGDFKNTSGDLVAVDQFNISGIPIPIEANNHYELYTSYLDASSSSIEALFGTSLSIAVAGNSNFPSFNTNLYLPDLLQVGNYSHSGSLNKNNDLSITWNADSQNGQVAVYIVYVSRDPQQQSNNQIISEVVPDNGQYTFPSARLATLPLGERVNVGVLRGNQQLINADPDHEVLINLLTYALSEDLEVIN